jgi:hypothetical protein
MIARDRIIEHAVLGCILEAIDEEAGTYRCTVCDVEWNLAHMDLIIDERSAS